ncbi:MAG: SPFH domain-containing protein, partial [Bilifractor sp.]|nr:SPFH domain-containing protein [Bilifractor sp.]
MEEKQLMKKSNGMPVLLLLVAAYVASVFLFVTGINLGTGDSPFLPAFLPAILWWMLGWILCMGLKVVKPQEALVLTLFGKYIGTIKTDGFYYVNPFCSAVNPAAKTKLGQSGDVNENSSGRGLQLSLSSPNKSEEPVNRKISLKAMTLNNAKQKVNDVLGNPVEIGVAVIWRVNDTAKAVFNVDNYKEYLSLQVDAAVRDIVKIYPYDVAPNIDTTGDGLADDGSLRGST